ncbi:MAG: hypothetical protein MUO54_00365 [Anaerolineales bacterium]|nr:hypothetical protein [Anaerolineales bacterium]
MKIEDLTLLPTGHSPSPYTFPVPYKMEGIWGYGVLQDELILCAVGWLGDTVPTTGVTPSECTDRLWDVYQPKYVISDGTRGWHNCEMCEGDEDWYPGGKIGPQVKWQGQEQRIYGHGHFLIHYQDHVFISPALILHYILDHGYKPPDEFIEGVCQGKFLTLADLVWTAE